MKILTVVILAVVITIAGIVVYTLLTNQTTTQTCIPCYFCQGQICPEFTTCPSGTTCVNGCCQ